MSAKKKARIEHDPPQAGKDEAEQTGVLRSDAMFPTAKDFDAAAPYPHGHVENLLETTFYEQLRAEVKQLQHTRKETDLFSLAQSPDLKNLDLNPQIHSRLPCLLRLRDVLYSADFRRRVEDSAGLPHGTLIGKTDLASSIYTHGDHLLMHDDVIGTRNISFILYLTDSPWTREDGGLLELYAHTGGDNHQPLPQPHSCLLPSGNSLSFFKVRAGSSYHAVSEVQAELPRQRISIQGWFHGEAPLPPMHALPSLGVIKALSAVEWLSPAAESSPSSSSSSSSETRGAAAGSPPPQKIDPMYTSSEGTIHAQLAQMLMQQQSANLGQFLVDPPAAVSSDSQANALEKKYTGKVWPGRPRGANPIVERFVRVDPLISLDEISNFVAKLLGAVEGLEVEARSRPIGRLFRRGQDYTVATAPLVSSEDAQKPGADRQLYLYWTYCQVAESDDWDEGGCGGFECVMPAEDEDNPEVVAAYDPEADSAQVLNIPATPNSLSLVLSNGRDLRFVKYLSNSAPSHRIDTSGVFRLRVTGSEEAVE